MPLARGWNSHSREPPAPDRDVIRFVISSSALLYQRAFRGAARRTAAVVGHWRFLPKARRSRCP